MTARLFVTCTPGLEQVLLDEVSGLGYKASLGNGGVLIENNRILDEEKASGFERSKTGCLGINDAIFLNIHLRTASRVLLELLRIETPTKPKLYNEIYDYNWTPYFSVMPTFAIEVPYLRHPSFTNSMYVAQLAKDAICDNLRKALGKRPSVDKENPQVQLHIALDENEAIVYFDTSLVPLFKRGYRTETVEAPLKETLAAAILKLSGFTSDSVLLDPCAGSGTFLIEAGLMASNHAPGLFRTNFGFTSHPDYNVEDFLKIRAEAEAQVKELPKNFLRGFEQDGSAYRKALRAIAKTGLMSAIELVQKDFRSVTLSVRPNLVVTNPPFGVRLGKAEQWVSLYEALGDLMKKATTKPARGAVLTASLDLARAIHLKPSKKIPIWHGGLDCMLLLFELY